MNTLKMIGLAVVVSAGMAMAQAPSQAPNPSNSQQNQNQSNAGATPAAPAAGAQTPNAGKKMPATASPLELIALLGLGTLGVGAAVRKPRLDA